VRRKILRQLLRRQAALGDVMFFKHRGALRRSVAPH
jgi:hypothetical protein